MDNYMEDKENNKISETKAITMENIKYLTFYSLSLVIALGINDIAMKVFEKYYKDSILSRVIYLSILIVLVIWLANVMKYNPNDK